MSSDKDGSEKQQSSISNLEEHNKKKRKSRKECINSLKKANKIVDGNLTIHDYRNLEISPSHTTISDRFNGWNNAKEEANLQTNPSPKDVYNEGPPDILTYTKKEWENLHKTERHRKRNQARISKIKLDSGCINCGYDENPVALEFHHTKDDKFMDVGTMISQGYSKKRIKEEIEKCVILCSNCHKIEESGDVYNV